MNAVLCLVFVGDWFELTFLAKSFAIAHGEIIYFVNCEILLLRRNVK